MDARIGCVVIGRNEGERLRRCLESLAPTCATLVYVDSDSSDGSVETAKQLGAHVVALDLTRPFTAARARDEGFEALSTLAPSTVYVLFVDGDCEVVSGFVEAAAQLLDARPEVAVVCGRRRERHPEASVYNLLCDMEWDTPIGEAQACGGDALVRVSAFREVGGYDPTLIAGEEPELCLRLRRRGHRIVRIDREMTLHDAAMTRFEQWWKRAVRAGHAYAEGAYRHGRGPERHWVRETARLAFYGAALPAASISLAPVTLGTSLGLLSAYPVSALRSYRASRRSGHDVRSSAIYAAFTTLAKFPEAQGAARFALDRLRGRTSHIIEYKSAAPR